MRSPFLLVALVAAAASAQAPPDTTHLLPPPAPAAAAASSPSVPVPSSAHALPFGAEGVELRLAVANRTADDAGRVRVSVEAAPTWLTFRRDDVSAGDVGAGGVGAAVLRFDVAADAPVGERGEVVVRTEAAGGGVRRRTLAFVVAAPVAVRLRPPAPNPTAGPARLAFELPAEARVDLRVYDVLGREVSVLAAREPLGPGRHERAWDGAAAAGVYVVRLVVDGPGGTEAQTVRLTRAR